MAHASPDRVDAVGPDFFAHGARLHAVEFAEALRCLPLGPLLVESVLEARDIGAKNVYTFGRFSIATATSFRL